jgi:hypothetical protein
MSLDFNYKNEAALVAHVHQEVQISEEFMSSYYDKWRRFHDLYYVHLSLANLNPFQVHVRLGKVHSLIEMWSAKSVKNLFGQTPYFPLFCDNKIWRPNVEQMERLVDGESARNNFFETLAQSDKECHISGTAWLEPYWDLDPRVVEDEETIVENGYEIGKRKNKRGKVDEGLKLRWAPPWAVLFDPQGANTGDKRWTIEKKAVSTMALKARIDAGLYEIDGHTVKWDDVKGQPSGRSYGEANGLLMDDLRATRSTKDDDIRLLLRVWHPYQREYLELLDGERLIKKEIRADVKREDFVDLCPLINSQDPKPNNLLGLSDIQGVEQLCYYIDDSITTALRIERQRLDQVVLYNSTIFKNSNDLFFGGGSRIGVTQAELNQVGNDWDRLVHPIQTQPQSADSYRVREEMERHLNEAVGMNQTSRGSEAQSDMTAFEIRKMTEATDELTALKLKLAEVICLQRLGIRSYKLVAKNMPQKQIDQYLGPEAKYLTRPNPDDIPGGCNVRLRAASLLAGREGKQNERLAQIQTIGPFENQKAMADEIVDNSECWDGPAKEAIKKLPAPPPAPPGAPAPGPGGAPIVANEIPTGASTVTAGVGGAM